VATIPGVAGGGDTKRDDGDIRHKFHLSQLLVGLLLVVMATSIPFAAVQAGAKTKASTTPFASTGYFSTGQYKGHWYLVTPQGQPFYADGVDHVSASGDVDKVTHQCPYCQAIAANYPSAAAWQTATLARLRSWGFNSLGPYSDNSTLGTQIPFTVELSLANGDIVSSGNDFFAPSFVTQVDANAAAAIPQWATNPNVIGYFTNSELNWGPPVNNALDDYLALPAGSPGRTVAQQYVGNPEGFVTALATRYFEVTSAALKMYDTHHLNLGVKAEGQEVDPALLEAARPYVDVFSVEDYQLLAGFAGAVANLWPQYLPVQPNLANFFKYANKPIMIGEEAEIATGPQDPNTDPGIYLVSPNQPARAAATGAFLAPLYQDAPWMVGDEWFEYTDEPVGGRTGNGENNNFGLVNVADQPYPELTTQMSSMHSILPDRLLQTGPTCDSWVRNPDSSVSCNAYMPKVTYPVSVVAQSPGNGKQGTVYSDAVYAGGGDAKYTYRIISGALPKGLRLKSSTGTITGTPKGAGTFDFTVQVTDSNGSSGSQALSVTIAPSNPPSIITAVLKTARQNKAYSATLDASGGVAPYQWSLASGALPAGLTLSAGGTISGTPTVSGTFTFGVGLSDSWSPIETASATLSLTVKAAK